MVLFVWLFGFFLLKTERECTETWLMPYLPHYFANASQGIYDAQLLLNLCTLPRWGCLVTGSLPLGIPESWDPWRPVHSACPVVWQHGCWWFLSCSPPPGACGTAGTAGTALSPTPHTRLSGKHVAVNQHVGG